MTDAGPGSGVTFSASLSILFADLALLDRPRAAAAAGFELVESWWPWPHAHAEDAEVEAYAREIDDCGTRLVLLNTWEGDARFGSRGLAGIDAAAVEFAANAEAVLCLAERAHARTINVLAGNLCGQQPDRAREVLISRIVGLARRAASIGAGVVVEMLNRSENPDYQLTDLDSAALIVKTSRALAPGARIGLLLDLYHVAASGIDLGESLDQHGDLVHHVQLADFPGRGAPGTGRAQLSTALGLVLRSGYRGVVGAEFRPVVGRALPGPRELARSLV